MYDMYENLQKYKKNPVVNEVCTFLICSIINDQWKKMFRISQALKKLDSVSLTQNKCTIAVIF